MVNDMVLSFLKVKAIKSSRVLLLLLFMASFVHGNPVNNNIYKAGSYSLTVKVNKLRNSKGIVQFSLYNKDGTIPDEKYTQYFRQLAGKINNGTSVVTFTKLPIGRYAVNILHDENQNGMIDKGFILPVEGVGFSNYQSIGLGNRPKFYKASFELKANTSKTVKVIYF